MKRDYPHRDFLFVDSAYFAQPHRKLAIIHDDFLYIYNKAGRKEELYDLRYVDNYERCNMMYDSFYDVDRQLTTLTRELFFSPRWDEVEKYRKIFREKREEIWRDPSFILDIKERTVSSAKKKLVKLRTLIKH